MAVRNNWNRKQNSTFSGSIVFLYSVFTIVIWLRSLLALPIISRYVNLYVTYVFHEIGAMVRLPGCAYDIWRWLRRCFAEHRARHYTAVSAADIASAALPISTVCRVVSAAGVGLAAYVSGRRIVGAMFIRVALACSLLGGRRHG